MSYCEHFLLNLPKHYLKNPDVFFAKDRDEKKCLRFRGMLLKAYYSLKWLMSEKLKRKRQRGLYETGTDLFPKSPFKSVFKEYSTNKTDGMAGLLCEFE